METLEIIFVAGAGLISTFLIIVMRMVINLTNRVDEKFDAYDVLLVEILQEVRVNREQIQANRKDLDTFRRETRENFKGVHKKIEANTAGIQANAAKIDAASARLEGMIKTNTAKIEANTTAIADLRDQLLMLRTENREDHSEMRRGIEKVSEQVGSFRERLAGVEGRTGAIPV